MNDAHERRAFVIVLAAVLLSPAFGFTTAVVDEWQVVARMLAGLALVAAVLLGVAAALRVAVVLLAIPLVASTVDTLDRNDF